MSAAALSLAPAKRHRRPSWLGGVLLALVLHGAGLGALLLTAPEADSSAEPLPALAEMRVSLVNPGSEPSQPQASRSPKSAPVSAPVSAPASAPVSAPVSAPASPPVPSPAPTPAQPRTNSVLTATPAAPQSTLAAPAAAALTSTANPAPARSEAPARPQPPRFDADYLANPAPAYPPVSRRNGEQGAVRLRVLVSADGLAQEVEVAQSSGHPRLDSAARQAVRQWRFVPARLGGQPVGDWVVVPIDFKLDL